MTTGALLVDPTREQPPGTAATGPAAGRRLTVWPKRWIYLACAVLLLPAARAAGMAWMHAAALVALLLIVADALLRQWVAQRMARFERELTRGLQHEDRSSLLALYRGQWLLRLAAPRHALLGKLALIYQRLGQHLAAEHALRDALDEAPPREAPSLAHRLGDGLYVQQRWDEAERFYRLSQDEQRQPLNAGTQARIARLIRQRGGDLAEAEGYLRRAVELGKGRPGCGLLRGQLVELLAELGQRDDAVWHLQLAEEELGAASGEQERVGLERAQAAVAALPRDP